jgi:uncharacterized membrane protein
MKNATSTRLVFILLLFSFISPMVSASFEVAISASPMAQEADADNPAEYSITVSNTGDDDMTVNLATSQDPSNCNGFTSNVEQISGTVDAGTSETVTLTVTVNDQANGDCETTVTATANAAGTPGQPKTADVTVTTTAGDGGGLYAVKLTVDEDRVTYDGDSNEFTWDVDVENTGENQETIQLEINSDSDCESDTLDATVEPTQVQLESGDSETVEVTVEIPNGPATEAGSHCFILDATVSNDPNIADSAEDNLTLTIIIPQVKECDSTLQFTSMSLDPGEVGRNSFTVTNTGNTDWTVSAKATADNFDVSEWISVDFPTSSLLGEPGSTTDTHTFDFDVSPDDSVEADSQVPIKIQGHSGTDIGCEKILLLTVGQVHDASLSLSQSSISNVEPGTTKRVILTVENNGNGMETLSLNSEGVPGGWQVSFSQPSVTIGSVHSGNNEDTVSIDVNVPADASAEDQTQITFSVGKGGGTTPYDTVSLSVSVAARHDMSTSIVSTSQKGKSGQIVQYPIDISNTGNIRDTFKLQACDPGDQTGCNPPLWYSSFTDQEGNSISQIVIDPGQTERIFLDVTAEGEENGDRASILARIAIYGTSESADHTVQVEVSNFNYGMSITPVEPGEVSGQLQVSLPPGGVGSASFWVENTGDFPIGDNAVITVTGMDSSVIRTVLVEGVEMSEPFHVDIGAENRVMITLNFEVLEGISNGASGIMRVTAASELNAIQSTTVNLIVDVITIHDLQFTLEDESHKTVTYPNKGVFTIFVTNHGNVKETVVIESSDPLRFWSVDIVEEEFALAAGETQEVEVRVTPPSDMFNDDTYEFTITVMPKGLPVAGQPLDLSVTAEMPTAFIFLSDEMVQYVGYISIGIGVLLVVVLYFRSRSENQQILQALELEYED